MKRMKRALILFLVCVFMFTPAAVVFAGGETPQEVFYSLDVNKDGRIIKEELIVIYPDRTVLEKKFIEFDKNGNGYIEQHEFVEYYNR